MVCSTPRRCSWLTLSAEWAQFPGRSQISLPTHQAKTDVPRLDFYTMCELEAIACDADHAKYDEDLNATLIFVRLLSLSLVASLTFLEDRPAFCREISIRHRRSISTSA